ncbi:MAG: DUF2147 domain-containing protein [Saprospiraceae bacterium]|nr:DUF2147 domain-containing protein [Saprospiraceae bacterium]
MKIYLTLIGIVICGCGLIAQSAIGTWKTIDDEDGTVKSHVSIYEEGGKLFGKVVKLINPERTTCSKCKGDKKDKPIEGMVILWDLAEKGDGLWKGGKIMDPKNGKEYKCKIELEDDKTLNVRGFIGFSLIGRTQTWYRLE